LGNVRAHRPDAAGPTLPNADLGAIHGPQLRFHHLPCERTLRHRASHCAQHLPRREFLQVVVCLRIRQYVWRARTTTEEMATACFASVVIPLPLATVWKCVLVCLLFVRATRSSLAALSATLPRQRNTRRPWRSATCWTRRTRRRLEARVSSPGRAGRPRCSACWSFRTSEGVFVLWCFSVSAPVAGITVWPLKPSPRTTQLRPLRVGDTQKWMIGVLLILSAEIFTIRLRRVGETNGTYVSYEVEYAAGAQPRLSCSSSVSADCFC
jgi:hypothetical protein